MENSEDEWRPFLKDATVSKIYLSESEKSTFEEAEAYKVWKDMMSSYRTLRMVDSVTKKRETDSSLAKLREKAHRKAYPDFEKLDQLIKKFLSNMEAILDEEGLNFD